MFNRDRGKVRHFANVLVAVTVGFALVACDGADDREAKYRQRGKELFERADYSKASVEFRNALQIKPTSVEAIFYLGRIAEAQNDPINAHRSYERAFQQNEAYIPALIKLGEFALASNEPTKAQDMAERALAKDANSAAAHALMAAVHATRGMTTQAEAAAQAALRIEAAHPQASTVLAGLAAQRNDIDGALAFVDAALKRSPKELALLLARLQIMDRAGRADGVDEAFRSLIEVAPGTPQYKVQFARRLVGQGRIDEAETIFRNAIARDDSDVDSKMLLVALLMERRGVAAAETTLREFMARAPTGNYAFHFRLAELYSGDGRRDQARAILQDVIDRGGTAPGALAARPILARLALGEGKPQEAERLVADVLGREPNNADALIIRAGLSADRQDFQPAIVDLRNVLRSQPTSAPALRLLADVYRADGQPLLALDVLRSLVAFHPADIGARIAFGDQLRVAGQRERALAEYDSALRVTPDNLAALSGKALASIELGNLVLADSLGRHMLNLPNGEGPANMVLGLVALQKKDEAAAIANFTRARQARPWSRDALALLVRVYDVSGQREAGVKLLEEAIASQPNDTDARVLLADLQFNQGRPNDAEATLQKTIAMPARSAIPYMKLGSLYLTTARVPEAMAAFKSGTTAVPGNIDLLLRLAQTQETLADHDGARQSYEAVLRRDPRHLVASNNLAILIADVWPRDTALMTQARRLAENFRDSNNAALLDTLGWIQVRLGNLPDAVQLLEKAAALDPAEPQIRYHLGAAYHAQGDTGRARSEFERAAAATQTFRGLDEAKRLLVSN